MTNCLCLFLCPAAVGIGTSNIQFPLSEGILWSLILPLCVWYSGIMVCVFQVCVCGIMVCVSQVCVVYWCVYLRCVWYNGVCISGVCGIMVCVSQVCVV